MKQKGFTLIELLAVIVVLAIIALISVPILLNVIDSSKRGALQDSAYGIIDAGELYYAQNLKSSEDTTRYDFEVKNNEFVNSVDNTKKLPFKGSMPKTGTLQINGNGKTAVAICTDKYCACKSVSELKVTVKTSNCNIDSETGEIEDTESSSNSEPIGTVITYMVGSTAPKGYLTCDGTVYNINDYKALAEEIKKGFGSYNYYGGDGTTTFAVPDLRGEFLRGTGTATRNTGSGSNVGIHQAATKIPMAGTYNNGSTGGWIGGYGGTEELSTGTGRNQDISGGNSSGFYYSSQANTESNYKGKPTWYTSRPTNTSVLYCIKY